LTARRILRLDSSSTKISPISDANKALVRLAFIRCNWSTGGSPAVAMLDVEVRTSCVYLAKAFLTRCILHSHGDQSLLKNLLKEQHLTAQENFKYFLFQSVASSCSFWPRRCRTS